MIEHVQLTGPLLQRCEWSTFIPKWTQNGLLNSSICLMLLIYIILFKSFRIDKNSTTVQYSHVRNNLCSKYKFAFLLQVKEKQYWHMKQTIMKNCLLKIWP